MYRYVYRVVDAFDSIDCPLYHRESTNIRFSNILYTIECIVKFPTNITLNTLLVCLKLNGMIEMNMITFIFTISELKNGETVTIKIQYFTFIILIMIFNCCCDFDFVNKYS